MTPLAKKIEEAVSHIDVAWDDRRARAVERGLLERQGRGSRRRTWTMLAAAAAGLALVGSAAIYRTFRARDSHIASTNPSILGLQDGSRVALLGDQTEVTRIQSDTANVTLALVRGSARFDVTPNAKRLFRVLCSPWTIEVLGTLFTVEQRAQGVFVSVERGHVRVSSSNSNAELRTGESRLFTRNELRAGAPEPAVPTAEPSPSPRKTAEEAKSWREFAERGEFGRAYEVLSHEVPRDDPDDLLLAADVARLSGHPGQAVDPLRKVIARYRNNPRAPLAAFTLGRVLLDELGRPREAAEAFASVRSLDPKSLLAEDALARQVEALSRAGESSRARQLAQEYVRLYPTGRKIQAVRRLGNLAE
jgi:transmembrane sensor